MPTTSLLTNTAKVRYIVGHIITICMFFVKMMRIVQFSIAFCNPQSPDAQREYMLHLDAGFRKWKS